jgi:hypothetical protein
VTLLNNLQSMPVAVRYIHGYLSTEGPVEKTRLIAALAPATLSAEGTPGSPILDASLTTCEEIGLVQRAGSELGLHPDLPHAARAPCSPADLRATLRRLVLGSAVNDDLWVSSEGMRDFTRAMCWYLALDVERAPGQYEDTADLPGANQVQSRTLGDDRVILNENRWPQFERWAPFLGLACLTARRGASWLQPDPTVAVRDVITTLALQRHEWPIRGAVAALAAELPVLDSGRYRIAVEERMTTAQRGPDAIAPSLALALTRLRLERIIRLSARPDADTMVWTTIDGEEMRVSHLEIGA